MTYAASVSKTRLGAVVVAGLLPILTACSSFASGSAGSMGTPDVGSHHRRHTPHRDVIEAAPAPSGFRVLKAPRSGIQFAAPSDWVLIDAGTLADSEAMQDFAEEHGMSLEQLRSTVSHYELTVVGVGGDTVNVVPAMQLAEIPSEAALRSQFREFGGDVDRVRDIEVPAGQGRIAYISIEVGQQVRYGAGIFIRTNAGIVELNVATSSRAGSRHLVEQILPTIAPLGNAGRV